MEIIWFIIIVIVLGLGLLYILAKFSARRPRFTEADRESIRVKFKEVDELLSQKNYSSAIMHADKLTDFVLQKMNFKGETMAERMRDAEKLIGSHYQDFWWAHKLRNQIVHEIHFEINENTARRAIKTFRSVINNLKAL